MIECGVKSGWEQFLEFIENRCSSAEYENWIAPIRLIESNVEKVILEVPNVFVQEYLLDNFSEVLCNFLPLKTSGAPAIVFQMAIDLPKINPKAPIESPTSDEGSSPLKL